MTTYQTIRYERSGDIGTLTLARPEKRNAQNPLMWQELRDLGSQLLADDTLRCLLVTAKGPTFSAGIDLVEGLAGAVSDWAEGPLDDQTFGPQHRCHPGPRLRRRAAAGLVV